MKSPRHLCEIQIFSFAISTNIQQFHYNLIQKVKLNKTIKLAFVMNIIKGKKSLRKFKTEEGIYEDHLVVRKKELFNNYLTNPQQSSSKNNKTFSQQTNFGFPLTNQYAFVLLHLRNKTNKNVLNIKIPDVCVFVDKAPYDIVYNQNGFIRSFKNSQINRCKFKQLNDFFKIQWKTKNHPKNQQIIATFKEKQTLMLSQTDFIITCKKIKSDPFFKKLQYIQNKCPLSGQTIVSSFPVKDSDAQFIKLATQSLLGFKKQEQIRQNLSQQMYMNFMNQKISLFLNYEHNIRIINANFHYGKNQANQLFLINVTNLSISNLTGPLKRRQIKLKQIEDERNKILLMKAQKYQKYKSLQEKPAVKQFQSLMKQKFNKIVKDLNLLTVSQSKHEEIKNQIAFKKFHPNVKMTYKEVVSSQNFSQTRVKLFGSTVDNRKLISQPSKYVRRVYGKARVKRFQTEVYNTRAMKSQALSQTSYPWQTVKTCEI